MMSTVFVVLAACLSVTSATLEYSYHVESTDARYERRHYADASWLTFRAEDITGVNLPDEPYQRMLAQRTITHGYLDNYFKAKNLERSVPVIAKVSLGRPTRLISVSLVLPHDYEDSNLPPGLSIEHKGDMDMFVRVFSGSADAMRDPRTWQRQYGMIEGALSGQGRDFERRYFYACTFDPQSADAIGGRNEIWLKPSTPHSHSPSRLMWLPIRRG